MLYHHILTHFELHVGDFEFLQQLQGQDVNNFRDSSEDCKLEFLLGRNMSLSSARKRYICQVFAPTSSIIDMKVKINYLEKKNHRHPEQPIVAINQPFLTTFKIPGSIN